MAEHEDARNRQIVKEQLKHDLLKLTFSKKLNLHLYIKINQLLFFHCSKIKTAQRHYDTQRPQPPLHITY